MDSSGETRERAVEEGRPVRDTAAARWSAALALVLCGAVLGLAAYLRPDGRGYGTHEQFGTGPCGFLMVTGYPCPTCGMTTAFALAVRGRWQEAARVQPAGFVLALGAGAVGLLAVWVLAVGRWPRVVLGMVSDYRFYVGLLVLFLGGWGLKLLLGLLDGTLPQR